MNGIYDVAQICLSGHVITSMSSRTQFKQNYCNQCGERTITSCPDCNAAIKGEYDVPGFVFFTKFPIPKYCDNCGKPYPWTARKIETANELIALNDKLNDEQKQALKTPVTDVIKDTSATTAIAKYKKYITLAGHELAEGLKSILADVVSEGIKKLIWGH